MEAATRLIDKDGLDALTTNRIAETAGISIGTLYQYFADKQAILDKLGQQVLRDVTGKLLSNLQEQSAGTTDEQARILIRTTFGALDGRSQVHRELINHALKQGNHRFMDETARLVAGVLSSSGVTGDDGQPRRLSKAEAFVLTWSFVGVLRASASADETELPYPQIEEALLQLIRRFVLERGHAGSG
ncbi:TetR/AcrR family transcriptional regulator [Pseudomonas sp. N040]|uniref:TetR/AcrR family transcriptional regulator n=1 Tax=Pseudomonas sp. N040 TaxID=2785325 RepID=UPI0018A26B55|nr:TetR/AcrR family transcriptional regulator [Pseudomonas sp. N040]MBF7729573.1 helix-turn-helix transcriptional regulator [Pseudomonas sp. N040]MBW7013213.1 TetR/AcrR family transcriptional regulator; helix-turn-helix transcriptional regulator [Pseudomonas sp. N040]